MKHFRRKITRKTNEHGEHFGDMRIIPFNSEKYLQFEIGEICVLDSYQFLSTSLDEFVSLLAKAGKDNFLNTLKHGLKVTKIHRIVSFKQSPWLRPWIELCNKRRREANSDFESNLAKLQANATFGKTMENIKNRVNVRLIDDPDRLIKATSSISFRQSEIVNPELVMVRGARPQIKLNKPIAVGFSILKLSKESCTASFTMY